MSKKVIIIVNGVSTKDAARIIREKTGKSMSPDHVRRLCAWEMLIGVKKGRDWTIDLQSVLNFTPGKRGPKKKNRKGNVS